MTRQSLRLKYLRTVSRTPTLAETARARSYVSGADKSKAYGELFWALLNSSEFLFNH